MLSCFYSGVASKILRHHFRHSREKRESRFLYPFVGGSPTPNYFLLFGQEKVIKEKATLPIRPSGFLCCSPNQAAAQLNLTP